MENYLHIRNGMKFNVKKVWHKRIQRWAIYHFEPSHPECNSNENFFAHAGTLHLWTAVVQVFFWPFIPKSTSQEKVFAAIAVHLLNNVQIKQEIKTIYAEMVWNRLRASVLQYTVSQTCMRHGIYGRGMAHEVNQIIVITHSRRTFAYAMVWACIVCQSSLPRRRTQHVVCCSSNLLLL